MCVRIHLKMLGMAYPIYIILVCVYIYIAAQLSPIRIMCGRARHGRVRPGRGAGALLLQKRYKDAWLPLPPAGSWGRSQWQGLTGLPQGHLHPEARHYKLSLFQIVVSRWQPSMKINSESFICLYFLSCLGCLWLAGSGSLPLWQCGTKQIVAGAACDAPVSCQCLTVISFFKDPFFFLLGILIFPSCCFASYWFKGKKKRS